MNILILGGTGFIGRNFVQSILNKNYHITLANRGISNPKIFKSLRFLPIERHTEYNNILSSSQYDTIIDFSCYSLKHFKNTFFHLNFNKYIFISSSSVNGAPFDKSLEIDPMIKYANNKKKCEDFILQNIKKYSIIRPCYVVGENDNTYRFKKINGEWFWNNGSKLEYFIESENLCHIIEKEIITNESKIICPCD